MISQLIKLSLTLLLTTSSFAAVKLNVLIAKSQKEILIKGRDLEAKFGDKSKDLSYTGMTKLKLNCRNGNKAKSKKINAKFFSPTGIVGWRKNLYRGSFHVYTKGKYGCDLVNEIPLETYISTLLAKEMANDWPLEALKAQAVAARSYAYHKKIMNKLNERTKRHRYYDIENSEKHQVNGGLLDTSINTSLATNRTSGEVLTLSNGKLTPIFFHSKCGGRTLTPDIVWANKVDGYEAVKCEFCYSHGRKPWATTLSKRSVNYYLKKTLKRYYPKKSINKSDPLNFAYNSIKSNYMSISTEKDRFSVKKSRFRQTLGRKISPSNNFKITDLGDRVKLEGKGYGHGVGLCQFGAYEMARRGYSYKQILKHYFPNHEIRKLY